jgi:hypothetical protein
MYFTSDVDLSHLLPSYYLNNNPQYAISLLLLFNCFLMLFIGTKVTCFFSGKTHVTLFQIIKFGFNIIYYFVFIFIDLYSFCLDNLKSSESAIHSTLMLFYLIVSTIAIIFVGIYLKLCFNPLRKANQFWKLNNNIEINRFIFIIVKSFYISQWGLIESIELFSLLFWYSQIKNAQGCLLPASKIVELNFLNYIAGTDLSILIWLLTSSSSMALIVWIFTMSYFIIHGAMQMLKSNSGPLFLPICRAPSEIHYNFYF